jgi:DNA-binding XRE family transcriptional regulator
MSVSTTFKDMAPQIITAPNGDRLVVLSELEYRRLRDAVDMASDVAHYDDAKRRIASGEDELVPQEIADRLLDGENPVRVWREHRGLSLKALAEASDIAQPYLSQIETGKREGSVETLRRIAGVLRLSLDEIAG